MLVFSYYSVVDTKTNSCAVRDTITAEKNASCNSVSALFPSEIEHHNLLNVIENYDINGLE